MPLAANCRRMKFIVSPSDFGFHNALLDDGGAISFLDFEYSGRDDPAKLDLRFFLSAGKGRFAVLLSRISRIASWPASNFPTARKISLPYSLACLSDKMGLHHL